MPDETDEVVLYDVDRGVATITINRPHKLNAINYTAVERLITAFDEADGDHAVGVIVLTGAGERAFCTGGDVEYEDSLDPNAGRRFGRMLMRLSEAIRGTGKPVIAKVRGWCIGGGNELNLICDLTIAAESAVFGQVGPRMGSVPIWYATQLLPRAMGEKVAKEIIMLCQKYSATEAERRGWINKAVPDAQLDEAVREWCDILLSHSPQALRLTKYQVNFESDTLLPSVRGGFETLTYIHGTEEFHEGTGAFLEKRPADFSPFR